MNDKDNKIIVMRTDNKFTVFTFSGIFAFIKLHPVFSGTLQECETYKEKWKKENENTNSM